MYVMYVCTNESLKERSLTGGEKDCHLSLMKKLFFLISFIFYLLFILKLYFLFIYLLSFIYFCHHTLDTLPSVYIMRLHFVFTSTRQ